MPAKHNALLVGHIDCPECGHRAAVYQNVKAALYVRCPDCGCDQRNGSKVQTRLWYTMEREEGVDACKPANVPGEAPDWLAGRKAVAVAAQAKKKPMPLGGIALLAVAAGGFVKVMMG